MRIALVLMLLIASRVAIAGDEPDTPNGKAYFADGLAAFKRGDHAAASRAFAAGFEIEKWNGFLFAWAQSERTAGNCEKAIDLYTRFIATRPKPEAREHAIGWIKACGGELVEPPPTPIEPPQPPIEPPTPPGPQYTRIEKPVEGFHHKLAIGLGAGAIASGFVAAFYLRRAADDFDVAKSATNYIDVERIHERGADRLLYGRLAIGAGVAFATGAILRLVLHRTPTRFELVPMASGAAVKASF